MRYEQVVELLAWAGDHERPVRVVADDGSEVTGVPTSLDTHVTAHEVYLRPAGGDGAEVALSLARIARVELA